MYSPYARLILYLTTCLTKMLNLFQAAFWGCLCGIWR